MRELLNDAEVKIAYLKAGKPLIDCFGDISKVRQLAVLSRVVIS